MKVDGLVFVMKPLHRLLDRSNRRVLSLRHSSIGGYSDWNGCSRHSISLKPLTAYYFSYTPVKMKIEIEELEPRITLVDSSTSKDMPIETMIYITKEGYRYKIIYNVATEEEQ